MAMKAGIPMGPQVQRGQKRLIYTHVPRLRDLLPRGGCLGVTYVQVCVHNVKAANDREEFPGRLWPISEGQYYEIQGPKGTAQMALVGNGEEIPGSSSQQGEPWFYTDAEVETLTGLEVQSYAERDERGAIVRRKPLIWFRPVPEPEPVPEPDIVDTWKPPGPHPRAKRPYVRRKPHSSKELANLIRGPRDAAGRYTDGRTTPSVSGAPGATGTGEGREGPARVEGGDPAQWQQPGPESHES